MAASAAPAYRFHRSTSISGREGGFDGIVGITIDHRRWSRLPTLPKPCLVEVAGVAGSGKSTLTRSMCEDPEFTVGGFIHARLPSHLLRVARATPRLLPILASDRRSPQVTWPEYKLLVYVTQWRTVLRREMRRRGGITVLDQGPIYALVRLKAEGKPFTATPAFDAWWEDMLRLWVGELSAIVWLDASDDVLWRRINGRSQLHKTKGEGVEEGHRFLDTYRCSFDAVLGRIEAWGAPEVLRLDTEEATAEQLATELLPRLMAHAR
ncbi:MAG: ATP-binding protein [Actinobacteria bacterium]|nr:MAG: ATP-binding protein [Actinomycetota bacterium]